MYDHGRSRDAPITWYARSPAHHIPRLSHTDPSLERRPFLRPTFLGLVGP